MLTNVFHYYRDCWLVRIKLFKIFQILAQLLTQGYTDIIFTLLNRHEIKSVHPKKILLFWLLFSKLIKDYQIHSVFYASLQPFQNNVL